MEILGVTETVARHLREKIVLGELESGARLNEVQLAAALGISRQPLREAFRLLEGDQLVTCVPRKGTFVTPVCVNHFEEVYAARRMVEGFAIKIFEQKGIRRLDQVRETLAEASSVTVPEQDDAQGMLHFWTTFSNFHLKLVESSENVYIRNFYQIISLNLARYQVMYLKIQGTWKDSMRDHRAILALIERGDYGRAGDLLAEHLDMTFDRLKMHIPAMTEQCMKSVDR
jgi:DNA-binding GntR family transcriptional regulator